MRDTLQDILGGWRGLGAVCRSVPALDAWIFVALHDGTLGTPTGGTRMRVYARPADGLLDAVRLAEGMTWKWASIGLPFGGGKAVLALSRPLGEEERRALLVEYAAVLEGLRGAFATGEDLGTTPADMAFLARHTSRVHGAGGDAEAARDPGPYTARGVRAGMRAALQRACGSRELAGRTVLIQGVGDVGAPLARLCAEEGAALVLGDLEPARAERLAAELGGRTVPAEEALTTECDVLAPCAVGAVLDRQTIPGLRCKVVAGSANNQLAVADDADRLHAAGILYAPDFVVNGGGALAFGLLALESPDEAELTRRLEGMEATLGAIFDEAAERGESPLRAARRRAERTLADARAVR